MELDPVFLSRLQFAWLIAFHILMPALTVGLASFIAVLEGLHFFTRREIYLRISTFWIKIFSVAFGVGVVSGVIMPFQFGTNWSRYSDATANVLAPLFAYEGLTAFFLEAAFLGVLLFELLAHFAGHRRPGTFWRFWRKTLWGVKLQKLGPSCGANRRKVLRHFRLHFWRCR